MIENWLKIRGLLRCWYFSEGEFLLENNQQSFCLEVCGAGCVTRLGEEECHVKEVDNFFPRQWLIKCNIYADWLPGGCSGGILRPEPAGCFWYCNYILTLPEQLQIRRDESSIHFVFTALLHIMRVNWFSENVQACDKAGSKAEGKERMYTGWKATQEEKYFSPCPKVPRELCTLQLGPPQIISKPLRTEWCLESSTSLKSSTSMASTPPPTIDLSQYSGQLLQSLRRLRRQFIRNH